MIAECPSGADADVEKRKWPRSEALDVARDLLQYLKPVCERLIVAGSLRRKKPMVGDVEILYIPRFLSWPDPADLFGAERPTNLADHALGLLMGMGIIERRLSVKGHSAWGAANKLAVHRASGIPVDFFAATRENWFNYLVCRTGGAESNKQICQAAIDRGWKWHPYGNGFTEKSGHERNVSSERQVFELVGLPYLEPHERQ